MKKLLIALFVLATSQLSIAGVTSITKIKDVYVYSDYVVIKMANTHSNDDSCTHSSATSYLYLATDTDGGKKHYAAVLTAQTTGSNVRLGYSQCATWGSTTLPVAYNFTIFDS